MKFRLTELSCSVVMAALTSAAMSGCQTRTFGDNSAAPTTLNQVANMKQNPDGTFEVSCQESGQKWNESNVSQESIRNNTVCRSRKICKVNVAFAINMEGEMKTSFAEFRKSFSALSEGMQAANLATQYGAVGYRDEDFDVPEASPRNVDDVIPFTGGTAFHASLIKWQPSGGDDWPSHGLFGIKKATEMLAAEKARAAKPADINIVFYFSNAFGYMRRQLPFNFSIDELVGFLKTTKSTLLNLEFYASTWEKMHSAYSNDKRFIPAKQQAENILKASGLKGSTNFKFPPSGADLAGFGKMVKEGHGECL